MIYIPVLAKNQADFMAFCKSIMGKHNTTAVVLTRSSLKLRDKEYFFADSPNAVRGKIFKTFEQYGAAFLHPRYNEILDLVLEIAQDPRSK